MDGRYRLSEEVDFGGYTVKEEVESSRILVRLVIGVREVCLESKQRSARQIRYD